MRKLKLLLLLLPFLLGACAPKVSTRLMSQQAPLDNRENVRVYNTYEQAPAQATVIGQLKISDSGFSVNCNWDVVIEKARTEARKAGGNALKITEHKKPDLISTCHRIAATILLIDTEQEPVVAEQDNYYSPPTRQEDYDYEPEYPKLRLGINGGWSTRIARISDDVPPDFKKYMSDLKKGYHLGADASYFFSDQMGFGLKYSTFRASNSASIHGTNSSGTPVSGTMSDDMAINFVGPTFSTRYWDMSGKNAFLMSFGIGYMGYKNDCVLLKDNFELTSGTLGLSWDLGYDVGINKSTILGLQLSFLSGTLSHLNKTMGGRTEKIELDKDNLESLARIDLSVGLRFIK